MPPKQTPKVPYLSRRATVPLDEPVSRVGRAKFQVPDLSNIQGDIFLQFPKRWERFKFFRITNVTKFRRDLDTYYPRVTSSEKTKKDLKDIDAKPGGNLNITSNGIGFNKAGLRELDIIETIGDPHFDRGSQVKEKDLLGDMAEYRNVFKTDGGHHGVFIICSGSQASCKAESDAIQKLFNGSIREIDNREGHVRPGDGEFFGWRDGISQPALEGISKALPGQPVVKPGVIILGYPGDPAIDNPESFPVARPSWTKDGSFMVFRDLEQNVLFFEDYIEDNWRSIPAAEPGDGSYLTDDERKKLFGARMVGRFPSASISIVYIDPVHLLTKFYVLKGVPLARSPYREDIKYLHPDLINNFDFTESHGRCPFYAHIRKTTPRDLGPYLSKEFLDSSMIVRAGIPFGPEITLAERQAWNKNTFDEKVNATSNRGLLFVCYQSSIDNGFFRQTTGFANNDFFPPTGLLPTKIGQDPIIGGPKADQTPKTITVGQENIYTEADKIFYSETIKLPKTAKKHTDEFDVSLKVRNTANETFEVAGVAKKILPSATDYEQQFFVTSRGGEYYFMPSLSTLRSWGAKEWDDE